MAQLKVHLLFNLHAQAYHVSILPNSGSEESRGYASSTEYGKWLICCTARRTATCMQFLADRSHASQYVVVEVCLIRDVVCPSFLSQLGTPQRKVISIFVFREITYLFGTFTPEHDFCALPYTHSSTFSDWTHHIISGLLERSRYFDEVNPFDTYPSYLASSKFSFGTVRLNLSSCHRGPQRIVEAAASHQADR